MTAALVLTDWWVEHDVGWRVERLDYDHAVLCRRCGRPESAHCPQCGTCWPGETCECNPEDDP